MRKEIIDQDGISISAHRLERPQMLLKNGGNPQVLYAACSVDPCNHKKDAGTFNVQFGLELR